MRLWVVFLVACAHVPAVPTLPGMGNVHRPITTTSPVAQRHFDAGLALAYGFNFDEAGFEFQLAVRADPTCAMCWWGVAYISGPNINEGGKQWPTAYGSAQRAAKYASTPVEKALTTALTKRFAMSPMQDPAGRTKLHHAYAEAMREVAHAYPDDVDVLALASEALMIDTPIGPNWSKPDGKPLSPNIVEGQKLLEHALALSPDHIGAIHFYIHLLDDGPFQDRTLPYADKLGRLAPGAGHLVHMPSHVYLHVGRWADADDANIHAIAADHGFLEKALPGSTYEGFTNHPKDFLWYVLLWEGARARALELGTEMAHAPNMMMMGDPNAEDGPATYLPFTYVRFGMWDEALALPEPKGPASGVATHLARGLALVAKGKLDDAQKEPDAIRAAAKPQPDPPGMPPGAGPSPEQKQRRDDFRRLTAESAALQVTAAVEDAQGDQVAALAALQKAVAAEDQAPPLGEPPAWPLSARHRLGALLLVIGQPQQAAEVYREDLRRHPHNGWALFGLATALDALHDPNAKATWREFQAAWARSDVKLGAPTM